jgi:hypothetical protein
MLRATGPCQNHRNNRLPVLRGSADRGNRLDRQGTTPISSKAFDRIMHLGVIATKIGDLRGPGARVIADVIDTFIKLEQGEDRPSPAHH